MAPYQKNLAAVGLLSASAAVEVSVPLLETAAWALQSEPAGADDGCIDSANFSTCRNPWGAAVVWRYAIANVLAAPSAPTSGSATASSGSNSGSTGSDGGSSTDIGSSGSQLITELARKPAARAAPAVARFFAQPAEETFRRAARKVRRLLQTFRDATTKAQGALPQRLLQLREEAGLGVPFPVLPVLLPNNPEHATLQLRGGLPMPLLALAVPGDQRPSIANMKEALLLGVRRLDIAPASADIVGKAIESSRVPRSTLFLSLRWELPLVSEKTFDRVLARLGVKRVELLQVVRVPDADPDWRLLARLKGQGKVAALGAVDFAPQELERLPSASSVAVEYAQCLFTPYRPGPRRSTWKQFGQKSIALAASGLLGGRPHMLRPREDPHIRAIAIRNRRSEAQVLIRWALQLGLSVVFKASQPAYVAENLDVFDFMLSNVDMQLLSGLATLAEPAPPGDGFARVYDGAAITAAPGLRESEL